MKKLAFLVAFAAIVAGVMVACSQKDPMPNAEQEYYTVSLDWEGEILDVWYEPLRSNSTDDLYGIQVYQAPDVELEEGKSTTWTRYAYGLFDNADDITIQLLKGYKYKFVATMVVDGKNKISHFTDNVSYSNPFYITRPGANTYGLLANKFDYQSTIYFSGLEDGTTSLQGLSGYISHPNTERFYGELEDYIPGSNGDKAKIKMKRTSFGAKFIAKGKLAKSGTLQVQMTEAPKMELALSNSDNQISDIFTFDYVKAAWADNQYKETIAVTFNWIRTDGTTLPLGTHNVTYKRNATTVVQVNIENEANAGGVGFEYDEADLGDMPEDGENDLTITDGEVVDTDVDTNQ
ncbi:MAG: hypothetical protein IIV58_00010 [Alistipes sp.]|nr:hypothetical protein [Alistipes sp.]